MPAKPGRLSKEDQKFILANVATMTAEELAEKLNRNVELVEKFIRTDATSAVGRPEDKMTIRQELRDSQEWIRLKAEFSGEELKLFEEKYVSLMQQFKGNVLASEETQIMQAIKFVILMSRNLIARSKAVGDVNRLEQMMDGIMAQNNYDPRQFDAATKSLVLNLETQLQASRAAEQAHTNEYVKLQERHDSLMKSLRAARDQRVKDVESSRLSIFGLIKSLQQKDVQDREGMTAEKMRLAGRKEYERLGQYHTYEDGQVDRPILSADTVDMGEPAE